MTGALCYLFLCVLLFRLSFHRWWISKHSRCPHSPTFPIVHCMCRVGSWTLRQSSLKQMLWPHVPLIQYFTTHKLWHIIESSTICGSFIFESMSLNFPTCTCSGRSEYMVFLVVFATWEQTFRLALNIAGSTYLQCQSVVHQLFDSVVNLTWEKHSISISHVFQTFSAYFDGLGCRPGTTITQSLMLPPVVVRFV